MKSNLEMKRPFLAELAVEVTVEDVNAAVNRAYAALSRTARVRGFRQGKAPRGVLKRMYGPAVLHEVRGDIINDSLLKALEEHELVPLAHPELDAGEVSEGAPYAFKASFEVRPKLDAVVYDGVELERAALKVEDAEVDAELERLQAAMASLEDLPEPRPVEKGDAAVISLRRATEDGWESDGLKDQQVVVGEGHAPEAVEDALLGMSVGDEKEVDLGPDSEPAEKRVRYLMKLTDLKARKLPALDDELAKDTGQVDTLEELKADIRKRIGESKDRQEDRRLQGALWDALREKNPMELPPSLVSRQTEALKAQLYRGVMEQLDPSSEDAQESLKRLEESAEKTATEMVHQQLLMMEISRLNDIKVEDADVDEAVAKRAAEAGVPAPLLRAEMNKAGRQDEFSFQILETKIFDFAKSLVKITEVEGEAKNVEKPSAEKATAKKSDEKKAAASEDGDKKEGAAKSKAKATKKAAAKKSGDDAPAKKAPAKKKTTKAAAAKKTGDGTAEKKKTTAKKAATKKTPAEK